MAARPVIKRVSRLTDQLTHAEPCIFCQTRQLIPSNQRPAPRNVRLSYKRSPPLTSLQSRRSYSRKLVRVEKSPQQQRLDIDQRNRLAYYSMIRSEKLLAMDPRIADKALNDMLSLSSRDDPTQEVQGLAKELKIDLLDLTDLALATFKIPDVNDMTGRLPPSQHKTMAKRVLLVCSKVGEPSAILHIMKAVYLKRSDPIAQDIASHFTAPEIATCRRDLEKLAAKEDPDAMTLLGQFLEVEGRKQEARKLYECALELKDTRYSQGAQNPTGLLQVAPWNALAELLRKEKDSASQAQAKAALEKGAFKADDPVAYLSLATMYEDDPKNIDLWLESASKAAASGSLDAMYAVGILHLTAFENGKPRLLPKYQQSKKFTNWMSWLTRQNKFRPTDLAVEWFQVAANLGHKPSMAKLVDMCKNVGKMEDTFSWLQVLANPPEDGKEEQWPELTAKARMDLSQLRSHPSFNSAAAAQARVKDQ